MAAVLAQVPAGNSSSERLIPNLLSTCGACAEEAFFFISGDVMTELLFSLVLSVREFFSWGKKTQNIRPTQSCVFNPCVCCTQFHHWAVQSKTHCSLPGFAKKRKKKFCNFCYYCRMHVILLLATAGHWIGILFKWKWKQWMWEERGRGTIC